LAALAVIFEGYNDEEKAAQLKKVRAASIYPFHPPTIAPLHLARTIRILLTRQFAFYS
jgi:hypothetical protein